MKKNQHMHRSDIKKGKPLLISYTNENSPHLTIETNRTCNIKCRSCYNLDTAFVKRLDQIKEEIELGIIKRKNVLAITIIGGEPTLHPDLCEIIQTIKSKNIICQLLTNGKLFLEDGGDQMLENLIEAGLDKILLHVDEGQLSVYSDLDKITLALFDKFEARKIFFSLSVTIFHDTQELLPEKIKKYASYSFFDGILGLMARNIPLSLDKNTNQQKWSVMKKEYDCLAEKLFIEPVAYLPTSLSDEDISWLFYFYYINANTGKTFSRSTHLLKIFSGLYRLFTGKNPFGLTFTSWQFYIVFIFSSLAELIINPARIGSLYHLVKNSSFFSALRIHTVVLQNLPQYNQAREQVQFCYCCPDATIRNGNLTPLCMADYINPVPGEVSAEKVNNELKELVYEHLDEV